MSPAPRHVTRAPFSAVSAPTGHTSTGTPSASARTTVPWPPFEITSEACGIT